MAEYKYLKANLELNADSLFFDKMSFPLFKTNNIGQKQYTLKTQKKQQEINKEKKN